MQFWKSSAIGLVVLLGISYVGFAYVYNQGGGIMIAGGQQPKVVTQRRVWGSRGIPTEETSTKLGLHDVAAEFKHVQLAAETASPVPVNCVHTIALSLARVFVF